ncbi:hypothetical protein IKT18_00575 [Candidatus Saccharibacteria bacterium]|nr:hypothetical protein [Candidatus Saccharibacteria bacterium]
MSSKLLINVNDASSAVVPDTGAPDTGMFSVAHTDGVNFNTSMVLPIIGIIVLSAVIMVGIIVAISRRKKVNRFTTHTNKHLVAKLTTLSVVVLLGALGVLNADKLTGMVNATDNSEEDTLTITASDIKIDVDLNDKAVFATGESIVTVSSATEAGYTLMAYVDSTTTDLTNETNKSSKSTISMLSSNEPAALTDNTWGIATTKPTDQTSEVFTGLTTTLEDAITLKITDEATTANDKSTFYYGTYITPDLDYGTYSGTTITYIAIANIVELCNPNATSITEAKCLQDFAGPNRDQIVDSMTPETQYTLIDKRDEKSYTIAKLKQYVSDDGPLVPPGPPQRGAEIPWKYGVWMTQNLDLDLDSNATYTNEDTDLGYNPRTGQYESASWTPSRSTYATGTTTWGLFDQPVGNYPGGFVYPESYDPGDKYWSGREGNYNEWFSYWQTCSWDSDNKPHNCNESLNPTSAYVSSTGIPQYHLGNYYNWTAAVAMNNSSNYYDGELIEQSICPAGWTLPRVGYYDDTFGSLWYENGFGDNGDWYSYWYEDPNTRHALWEKPLFFAASGGWYGYLYYVGDGGGFWSPIAYNEERAGYASFNKDGGANPSNGDYRINGLSVRCVARPVADLYML